MRRRLVLILSAMLAAMVVTVATLPLWLGAAAKWLGPSRGLTFGAYERVGYARFILRDAQFRRASVRVTVSQLEAETPMLWLWHRWRAQSAEIVAGRWQVDVDAPAQPRAPNPDRGWVQLRGQLQRIAAQLERWVPRLRAGPGLVRWPNGEVSTAAARWSDRELVADGLVFRKLKTNAALAFARDNDLVRLKAQSTDAVVTLVAESRGPKVSGDFTAWEQPGKLTAEFAPRGWMPAEATVRAANWNIAAEHLKLGNLYSTVRGAAQVEWRADHFVADITASSEPLRGKAAPPLEVVLRGKGNGEAITIESLEATLPGIVARLSEAVTVDRSGALRESAAQFAVQIDLASQPWFSARGAVRGDARLVSGLAAAPVVEFSLTARDVSAQDVALSAVNARGRLAWPRLDLAEAMITGGDGERLVVRGATDLRAKEILEAAVEGQIRRQSIARWLPKQPEFDAVELRASAQGKWAELKHSGHVRASGVQVKGVQPLGIVADWRATGASIDHFGVEAKAGATRIAAQGSVTTTALQLTALDFVQGDARRLQLKQPASVRWRPQLKLESIFLAGPEGSLNAFATAGETGRIEISAREISSRWLSDLVPTSAPPWQLTSFALVGAWDRGPMAFTASGGARVEIGDGRMAAVLAAVRGDKDGLRVEALRATEGEETVVSATGRVPVTLHPGQAPLLRIDPSGPLQVDASVAPNSAFWQKLAAVSGIELKEPQAAAHLTGTWQRPQGNATLKAARIAIDPKRVNRPLPAIESLDVQIAGDPGGVNLDTFTVRIEGQEVRARGRLPVPDGAWGELFKNPLAAARRGADLRVEIPEAEVAVFTKFLPAVLAPKGRLMADIHYKNGGLEGFLRLRDAASRPLGPLGVLQEISADIALSGRTLALRGVTARSGGQPVTLTGTAELPENAAPRFDLALRGENLPFVRQTGLLLRGDLDLKLQTPANGTPRLSGTVRLRDSLFLSDIRAYLPKGGASASRRPPYFAIEAAPVNTWSLAVDVVGDEFMRLRTPVFTGVASARFRLSGTLGEPRALGEITVNEGRVRMPFASFEVVQGSVRLTEADPFEPTVYVRGTGRRWGYDLTMELEGSASRPNVVFTSSPPLESEQVLLMVMTGAAPSNEINKSGTQRVASLGYFLGQSLLSSLGKDAGDPDRLSIASGEKISREGNETYDVEYKLTDRWTVTGEYNEFDEYNVGMKWRIFRGERATEHAGNGGK